MRKQLKPKPEYQHGDIREIKRFLLFPKTINNEMRWLERSIVKQEYEIISEVRIGISGFVDAGKWVDVSFVDVV